LPPSEVYPGLDLTLSCAITGEAGSPEENQSFGACEKNKNPKSEANENE